MKLLIRLHCFLMLLGGLSVLAQAPQQNNRAATPDRIQDWMSRMDADKSGTIELEEAGGRMKQNFLRIDTDKDGKLSRSELRELANRLTVQSRNQRAGNASQQRHQQLREFVEMRIMMKS